MSERARSPVPLRKSRAISALPASRALVQRKCSCGGTCERCRHQKLALERSAATAPVTADKTQGVPRSSGQELDRDTRAFMERSLGHDFGRVRVHTDRRAAESAHRLNALAYTVGRHVVFGASQFAPRTSQGRKLLAHELVHTVQQGQAEATSASEVAPAASDRETEADGIVAGMADGVAEGKKIRQIPPLVQRTCYTSRTAPPATGCQSGSGNFLDFSVSRENLFLFNPGCDDFVTADHESRLREFALDIGPDDLVEIHGFASEDGPTELNDRLSCQRALRAREVVFSAGVPASQISTPRNHGETPGGPDARSVVVTAESPFTQGPATSTPGPLPSAPLCPRVPTSTPASCSTRHTGYCNAAACFPMDSWIPCACTVSNQICDAIEVFTFQGGQGALLALCAKAHFASPVTILAKGLWFRKTNRCIWGHWRAALDALHDPSRSVSTSVTPEWRTAVSECRTRGVGSRACCEAQVRAEQNAIDRCGKYDSKLFGLLPTDVPGAPVCSLTAATFAPGPPFTGDFGKVTDRIAYGKRLCCQ